MPPEVPKLTPVPITGMEELRAILLVTTTRLLCDEVRETVVAAEVIDSDEDSVTEADEDLVTEADEDLVTEADVLEPEPPLMLNCPVKLITPLWEICKA